MPLLPTTLTDQIEAAAEDPLRVFVVGAGMAGLTTAQLLRGAGLHPILIDRLADTSHPGYMLALMPMVDAALTELDAWAPYRERSIELTHYRARAHTGATLRTDSMTEVLQRYGEYRGIERGELIEVLSHAGAPVTLATTVTEMNERTNAVDVVCRHGETTTRLTVDVVVVADGIGSRTRTLAPGAPETTGTDTGWGGWVVWAPEDEESQLAEELWGAGFFLGIYPVLGRRGVFLGGPSTHTAAGPEAFVAQVRSRLRTTAPRVERALRAVIDDPDPYYWPLKDVRAARWSTARTVLIGDAAAGFLPTAGIGAGMAIESGWVLAHTLTALLREAEPDVAAALATFEREQRPRVETAQDNSRSLARLMFSGSRPLAALRDVVMRLLSVQVAIRPITELLAHPPTPPHTGRPVSRGL